MLENASSEEETTSKKVIEAPPCRPGVNETDTSPSPTMTAVTSKGASGTAKATVVVVVAMVVGTAVVVVVEIVIVLLASDGNDVPCSLMANTVYEYVPISFSLASNIGLTDPVTAAPEEDTTLKNRTAEPPLKPGVNDTLTVVPSNVA